MRQQIVRGAVRIELADTRPEIDQDAEREETGDHMDQAGTTDVVIAPIHGNEAFGRAECPAPRWQYRFLRGNNIYCRKERAMEGESGESSCCPKRARNGGKTAA